MHFCKKLKKKTIIINACWICHRTMSASAADPTAAPTPTQLRLLCTHTLHHVVVVVFFFGAFCLQQLGMQKMHLGKNNEANMSPRLE